MTLPPIPKDRNWSPETWRAGLDEAVRRDTGNACDSWQTYIYRHNEQGRAATIAHATTLLDHGIVKPVVNEAEKLLGLVFAQYNDDLSFHKCPVAIAVIQSALDKARAGE